MELKEAIEHLINSEDFKNLAKQKNGIGGKYRMFLTRFKNGELKNGAAFDFLIEHGYKIEIKKPKSGKFAAFWFIYFLQVFFPKT